MMENVLRWRAALKCRDSLPKRFRLTCSSGRVYLAGREANANLFVERANDLLKDKPLCTDIPFDAKTPVVESSIARCRHQLTAPEIERYRTLARDAGDALEHLVRSLHRGSLSRKSRGVPMLL
jgi:hypothetical protein